MVGKQEATCRATFAVRPESVSTTASAEAVGTLKQPCAEVSTYSPALRLQACGQQMSVCQQAHVEV